MARSILISTYIPMAQSTNTNTHTIQSTITCITVTSNQLRRP